MYNKYLPVFLTVADCRSFNKASEKLYISPNAVMKQINQFENDLDLKLFERTKHGLKLTEEGEMLYQKAQYLLAYSEASLQEIRELKRHRMQDIHIGVSVLRNFKPLLQEIRAIRFSHPEWNLNVVSFSDEISSYRNMLPELGGKIDCLFGLYSETRMNGKANVTHLRDYPICVAASLNHPLAERKELILPDLAGYSLMIVERGDTPAIDAIREEIENNYPEIEIINVPSYDVSTFNLCASVNGIMLSVDLWNELHPLLINIPLRSEFTVPYGIMYGLTPSLQTAEFVREISRFFRLR